MSIDLRSLTWSLIVILLGVGCKKREESIITVEDSGISVELGAIADNILLLPLMLPDSISIGDVDQIKIKDSLIFVIDKEQTNSVTVFDLQTGAYLKQLRRSGEGPGQYLEINAFCYDSKRKLLLIHSLFQGVYAYDFESLDFETLYPSPDYIMSFEHFGNSSFFVVNDADDPNNEGKLRGYEIWDEDFHLISTLDLTESPIAIAATYQNAFVVSGEDLTLCVPGENSEVYVLRESGLRQSYTITYGDKKIPAEYWNLTDQEMSIFMQEIEVNTSRYGVNNFQEEDTFLSFWFYEGVYFEDPDRLAVHDKQTLETNVYQAIKTDFVKKPLRRPDCSWQGRYYHHFYLADLELKKSSTVLNSLPPSTDPETLVLLSYQIQL